MFALFNADGSDKNWLTLCIATDNVFNNGAEFGIFRFENKVGFIFTHNIAVGPELRDRLGISVHVENDATMAAYGEWKAGAAKGAMNAVIVTLGTGIGGGIVMGGQLQRGSNGFAGEIGHMIVDPSGPKCVCGQRGCWERYASGNGLAYLGTLAAERGQAHMVQTLAGGSTNIRGEHIREAALLGDDEALAIVNEFARWVALGLSNLTNLLDPSMLVIGGGLAGSGDLFLQPIQHWFGELLYSPELRPHPKLVLAKFAEQAGAIGAALLPEYAHISDI
jgi:glucokinase